MLNFFLTVTFLLSCDPPPFSGILPLGGIEEISSSTTSGHRLTFHNQCKETIWMGSIGNSGHEALGKGGWRMDTGTKTTLNVALGWSGRFWPRTGCDFNPENLCSIEGEKCCASGSCLTSDDKNFGLACGYSGTPPASLMEVTFDAASGNGPYDTYDISFVDGWSVPVSMVPNKDTFNPTADPGIKAPWCKTSGCVSDPICPPSLKVENSPSSCWSPCQEAVLTGKPKSQTTKLCCACTMDPTPPGKPAITCPDPQCEYGCTPYHEPPYAENMTCNPWDKLNPKRGWDKESLSYILAVKNSCPEVYAWQFDDHAATFNCRKTGGLVDYTITLCPGEKL